jgi:hypothetical protein
MSPHASPLSFLPSGARATAGVGLKPAHVAEILATKPDIGFFEIHAENYMSAGGPHRRMLARVRELYPLSVHGVGLSLGSTAPLDRAHLARLKEVVDFAAPVLVSEHLAWCDFSDRVFPDLLPLPYDDAALRRVADRIAVVQDFLGRAILIENPATYLRFQADALAEPQFLDALCARGGCGLLLDVNNVHVSAVNHGFDARDYLDSLAVERIGEIHLAGHARATDAQGEFLIDDHGGPVGDEVWALFRHIARRAGPRPTLIEWDNNLPDWSVLRAEADKASAELRGLDRAERPPAASAESPRSTGLATSSIEAEGDWQARFGAALAAPDAPMPHLFAPCDTAARFAVYRNNSAVAAITALEAQFPTVARLVGADAFSGLARAFARENPPRSPALGDYGARFPEFIADFLTRAEARVPYLPDVARLDWAIVRALRAPEAAPCGLDRLAALDASRLETARARLHPSSTLLLSDWPLIALRDPEPGEIADWRGGAFLVLRPEAEAVAMKISAGAAAFLRACDEGSTLAQAARAARLDEPDFDFGRTLVGLTRAGAFVDFIS